MKYLFILLSIIPLGKLSGQIRIYPAGLSALQDSLLRHNDTIRSLYREKGVIIAAFGFRLNKQKQATHVKLMDQSGLSKEVEVILKKQLEQISFQNISGRKFHKKQYYTVFWFRPVPGSKPDSSISQLPVPADSVRLVKYEKRAGDGEIRDAYPITGVQNLRTCTMDGSSHCSGDKKDPQWKFRVIFKVMPDGSTADFRILDANACGRNAAEVFRNCLKDSEPWIPAIRDNKTIMFQREFQLEKSSKPGG